MGNVKIGSLSISSLKLGSTDVSAAYLGSTLVYSGGTPPTPPTPTLQWVTFNNGDDLTGIKIYGVSGNTGDLANTFTLGDYIDIQLERRIVIVNIGMPVCYSNSYSDSDDVELIFSEIGCSDYYMESLTVISAINLYIEPSVNYKFVATYSDSTSYSAECDSSTELTSGVTKPSGYDYSAMTYAEINGDCVETIGYGAFSECSALSEIIIPNSVTSIGTIAFSDCSGLTSVDIPDSVTTIGDRAFYNCTGLISVTIGSGVTSIGNDVFVGCTSLTGITINATTPPTLVNYAFDYTNCPIFVPYESLDDYKSAWSDYSNRIYAWKEVNEFETPPSGYGVRVIGSVGYDLNDGQNCSFATSPLDDIYSLLWENDNWYNWRLNENGSFDQTRKYQLSMGADGWFTILCGSEQSYLGNDGDSSGQGGVNYATFPIQVLVNSTDGYEPAH